MKKTSHRINGLCHAVSGRRYSSLSEIIIAIDTFYAQSRPRYIPSKGAFYFEGDKTKLYPVEVRVAPEEWLPLKTIHFLLTRTPRYCIVVVGETVFQTQAVPFKKRWLDILSHEIVSPLKVSTTAWEAAWFYRGKWRACEVKDDLIIATSISPDHLTGLHKTFKRSDYPNVTF